MAEATFYTIEIKHREDWDLQNLFEFFKKIDDSVQKTVSWSGNELIVPCYPDELKKVIGVCEYYDYANDFKITTYVKGQGTKTIYG